MYIIIALIIGILFGMYKSELKKANLKKAVSVIGEQLEDGKPINETICAVEKHGLLIVTGLIGLFIWTGGLRYGWWEIGSLLRLITDLIN